MTNIRYDDDGGGDDDGVGDDDGGGDDDDAGDDFLFKGLQI